MVAGEPPFTGKTAQAVIAKVMTETPVPVRSRRATVPPRIEAALMRALEKTPADRFASAAEFAAALQPADPTSVTNQSSRPAERQIGPSRLPWVLVAILASVVGILGWRGTLVSRAADAAGGVPHLALPTPPGTSAPAWRDGIAVSARGRVVAFVATDTTGHTQLYLKRFGERDAIPVPQSVDAAYPMFSPDGTWPGFTLGNQIKKMSLPSGAITLVADSTSTTGEPE